MNKELVLEKMKRYCAYQERCHQEIKQKLANTYKVYRDDADEIIYTLITENFLNEERFAKAYAGGKFRIKGWGRKRIIRELKQKQVSDYSIKKGLTEIEEEDYLIRLNTWIEKLKEKHSELTVFEQNGKIAKYLVNKGYESELVWKKLNE